jgi:hypothetical protein
MAVVVVVVAVGVAAAGVELDDDEAPHAAVPSANAALAVTNSKFRLRVIVYKGRPCAA